MVFRKLPWAFGYRHVKKRSSRFIINERPKTFNDIVYPQLPFLVRSKPSNIKNALDKSQAGKLYGLTFSVTQLFKDERVKLNYRKATEIRPHVELLIIEAMRNGDKHRPTMALANFWLREKNLIHKLFKVFVPRYSEFSSSFTALHFLGIDYSKCNTTLTEAKNSKRSKGQEVILEMRGNCLPPITRPRLNRYGLLSNVLIDGARDERQLIKL